MKIKPYQIHTIVKHITTEATAKICSLLVYGTDPGLIRHHIQFFRERLVPDPEDPFSVTEYSLENLKQASHELLELMITPSYRGQKKLVVVYDVNDTLTRAVDTVLKEREKRTLCGFLLLEAQELPVASSLRILFEKSSVGAVLPCYAESGEALKKVLCALGQSFHLYLEPDACTYLAHHVVGNHAFARSEVEKLALYLSPRQTARLQDVKEVCEDNAVLEQDELVFAVGQQDWQTIDRHLQRNPQEPISLLRSVQKHFQRLHQVGSYCQSGLALEDACKTLKPPVFFKYKSHFISQVYHWSLDDLQRVLTLLSDTEAQCKQTTMPMTVLCTMALLDICRITHS